MKEVESLQITDWHNQIDQSKVVFAGRHAQTWSHFKKAIWSRLCLYLICSLIIFILTSMWLYRSNYNYTANTSRLTRIIFFLILGSPLVVDQPHDIDQLGNPHYTISNDLLGDINSIQPARRHVVYASGSGLICTLIKRFRVGNVKF